MGDDLEPDSLILLGCANQESKVVNFSDDISVMVNTEDDLNMEVPKRAITDVVKIIY